MRRRDFTGLMAGMLALGAGGRAFARADTTVIHAGTLIAEPGKPPATKQSIVVQGGRIARIENGFVPGDKVIDLTGAWVMPGLIDAHTHVYGQLELDHATGPQLTQATLAPPAQTVLNMIPRVEALLQQGFTTIRSMGDQSSTTYAMRDAINQGIVRGPRMLVCEAQIAVAGGDLDPSKFDVNAQIEPFVTNRGMCSGVDDCVRAVRLEIGRGADFIKLRQSGLAVLGSNVEMVETPEEVRAIIDTAHRLGRRVAAHVSGTPAYLKMVIEAGADTIEHGPLNDEAIALMRKHGTTFVPTLLAAKMIDYMFEEAKAGMFRAWKAGVPIAFGTDLGIFGVEHVHEEFGVMASTGMPPAEVLRAATVNAAAALGRASTLGRIAPGMTADIVATNADPLAKIDILGSQAGISFVMKEGKVFKSA